MIGVGLIGMGHMGITHYRAYQMVPGCRVVAIASPSRQKRMEQWNAAKDASGSPLQLAGLDIHASFYALLDNPRVDLVDICVPNDVHVRVAVEALRAEKHVLVEKPIALRVAEADAMIAASEDKSRLLMVAHLLPFMWPFREALEIVRSGRYGRLLAAHLSRQIALREDGEGVANAARSGGTAIDLHVHDAHFVSLLLGQNPESVTATGVVRDGGVVHQTTLYNFAEGSEGPAISSTCGCLLPKGQTFQHGFEIHLQEATLRFSLAREAGEPRMLIPFCILHRDGSIDHPHPAQDGSHGAFVAELGEVIQSARTGTIADELNPTRARDALALCWAEVASVLSGGKTQPVPRRSS